MKNEIHPDNYRLVIFHDTASDEQFLIHSTIETEETGTFDGVEYPRVNIEISSASHPFYTGQEKVLDTAGRVEKFKQRQAQAQQQRQNASKKQSATKKEQQKDRTHTAQEGRISIDADAE